MKPLTASRAVLVLGALFALMLLAAAVALVSGEQAISLSTALSDGDSTDATIFFRLRLPRVLLALLVGAALASSGATLQALMRNPLADPFVLGVSGGAAVGATLALATGFTLFGAATGPSFFAFLGSLGATGLVFAVGTVRGARSPHAALLTGVVFNAFASALITCIKTLSAPEKVGEILYWLAGTLGYESGSTLASAAVLQLFAIGGMWLYAGKLNLLSLGDDDAASLGVHVQRTRLLVLLFASLSVAGAVALSGLVGFVGLIVPHVLRMALGPDQRLLVPASALGGAAFLALSDLLARLLFSVADAEPPVGVVTALLGGPFFLLLLRKRLLRAG